MRGQAGEQGASSRAFESLHNCARWKQSVPAKSRQQNRVSWYGKYRPEHFGCKFIPVLDAWLHEIAPCLSINTENSSGAGQILFQNTRGSIVVRMSQGCGRVYPVQPVIAKPERIEEWRTGT